MLSAFQVLQRLYDPTTALSYFNIKSANNLHYQPFYKVI